MKTALQPAADVPTTAAPRTPAPPRALLAALSVPLLLSALGTSIANVGLPTLAQAFGVPFAAVQWVVLAYLLALTALVVVAGRLGDRLGRRRLLLGGLVLFSLASLAAGLAPTLAWLVAARALQGAGAAVMAALSMALVGDAVPRQHGGRAMGLMGSLSAVGTALGPTLGGGLIAGGGWRTLFLVTLPLGLLALWLVHRHVPVDRPRVAVARATGPDLLRDPALQASLAANALVAMVMMATLVVGPFYLAHALGLPAALAGLVMSAGPVVAALAGVPAGRAVDRFGAARMVNAGLAMSGAGCVALALLPAALGVAGYAGPLALVTAGYALFQAANNTGVMAGAGTDRRGVVSGLLNLSRHLGLVAGAWALGAVFTVASARADAAPAAVVAGATAAGLHATFGVAAALVALAMALTWRVGHRGPDRA